MSLDDQGSLQKALEIAQQESRSAFQDSFDTQKVLRVIYELIKESNVYINTHKASIDTKELERVARWVTKIVGILGLDANASSSYNGLGWASSAENGVTNPQEAVAPYSKVYDDVRKEVESLEAHSEALDELLAIDVGKEFDTVVSTGANDIEVLSLPYLRVVSKIRDELRRLAPSSPSKKAILSLSDKIRDQDLTNLGVYLDDRSDGQPSLIKFVPKEELVAQREEKVSKEREKAAQKEAARLAREKLEQEKADKAKVNPADLFKDDRFSAWDADGMPTKTKDGEDVPKSQLKKLKKDWDRQKKLFDEYQK